MSMFDELLREHEHARHWRIMDRRRGRDLPGRGDGYMPLGDAATAMSITIEALRELILTGRIEAYGDAGEWYARPAIVSVGVAASPPEAA